VSQLFSGVILKELPAILYMILIFGIKEAI